MADTFDKEELVMAMCLLLRRQPKRSAKKKKTRNVWVRKLFLERKISGAYNTLPQEMCLNDKGIFSLQKPILLPLAH